MAEVISFPGTPAEQTPAEFLRWLADAIDKDQDVPKRLRACIVAMSCGPDGVVLFGNSNCDMDYPLTHCGLADIVKFRTMLGMGELE